VTVAFRLLAADAPDSVRLLGEYAAELAQMYDGVDVNGPGMPDASAAAFSPPGGAFLVGYDDSGAAVACGGLKRLSEGVGEIKRMYVVPAARRRGLARVLLAALEAEALARGYGVVRMDTAAKHQHAMAFYEAEGYAPIAPYHDNPLAAWFGEKRL
jgi:GNAT superfamily N-acetyltransferase